MVFKIRHPFRKRLAVCLLLLSIVSGMAGGCATAPARYGDEVSDPLEKVNRKIYTFNSGFDRYVFRPIAKGYTVITPDPVEAGVRNFFVNLRTPVEIVNALLQFKPKAAAANTGRLVLNSTLGLGGLFDVATYEGLERRQEDFGQTLAVWGLPSGPYLMIPFLGPASLRDGVALYGETYGVPIYENGWSFDDTGARDKLVALRAIDVRAGYIGVDEKVRAAFDPYAFLRSAYGQRRDFLIYDGDPPEEDFAEDEFEED